MTTALGIYDFTITEWRALNDIMWFWYSLVVLLIPMNIIWIYKLFKPIDYTVIADIKAPFPRHISDKFLHIACLYPLLYYFLDVMINIISGSVFSICGASFTGHHIISLMYLPYLYHVRYWPWFWVGPGALHAFLLAWPEELWMNYIYLIVILIFQIGLYQKPWTNIKEYSKMKSGIFLIECACFFLWFFVCKNTL